MSFRFGLSSSLFSLAIWLSDLLSYLLALLSGGPLKLQALNYLMVGNFSRKRMLLSNKLPQIESLWPDLAHELTPEPIAEARKVECFDGTGLCSLPTSGVWRLSQPIKGLSLG